MRLPRVLKAARNWLWTLLQNSYFWGGVGGLLVVGIVVYFLVDGVIMPSYTRHGVSVRVPDVEGRPFEEAVQLLENRNLQVERQVGRFNPRVERGLVVDQNPLPSSDVKPGRRVYLTVNAGEVPTVDLPDLNGISVREAKNRVTSLGLTVDTVKADTIPSPYPNTVTRQKPAPGDSLKKGSGVTLWYSTGLGEDAVRVPNVVGRPVEEARSILLRRKLRSIVVGSRSSEDTEKALQRADTSDVRQFVRRQGRAPDANVQAGTEIRLFTTEDSTLVPDPEPVIQDTTSPANHTPRE